MDTATLGTTATGCPFGHGARSAAATPAAPSDQGSDQRSDEHVLTAIDRWSRGAEPDGLELARLVAAHIRTIGKHFLSDALLWRLADIRDAHGPRDRYLAAFLHSVLDKHEGRYHNATYISLPLLDELLADRGNRLDRTTLAALLMADVVRHETSTSARSDATDDRTRRTRITHARRFIAMCHGTSADDVDTAGIATTGLLARLPSRAATWFELSVLPVYTAHDEYFFIRALQAHEVTYRSLTAYVRAAADALHLSARTAITHLNRANAVFPRSAGLFRLVATMRAEQFHAFRDYTQGASAIQSEAYKRFELACGRPTRERLASDAFASVPTVRAEAGWRRDDLSSAYIDTMRDGRCSRAEARAIEEALDALEAAHQRWKTTHHSLASKMLGDAAGSGYTSGVPYLKRCLDNRLFFRVAAQRTRADAA